MIKVEAVVVRERVEPVMDAAELAVTLLHSYAMPVLRYRLGHRATRGGPCACGVLTNAFNSPRNRSTGAVCPAAFGSCFICASASSGTWRPCPRSAG